MSDTETPLHDDHWRRLAAELGLDIGPEPEHSEAHERTEKEREGPPRVGQDERRSTSERGRRKRNPPPQVEQTGRGFAEGLSPSDPVVEVESFAAAARTDYLFADNDEPETRPEPEDERIPAADEAQSTNLEAESENAVEAPDKHRRRRRSRRKKKGAGDSPASESGEATSDASGDDASIARTANDHDDQTDDLSKNWNVPSWDELIGSLYRPER